VLTVAEWGGGGYVPGRGGLFDALLTAAGARNVEQGSFGYYDVESLIAARPDALVYGDTYAGTTSLRADQDLHPALMRRYAGRRITYASLYGCGVPESADVTKQLQDGLRKVRP
jgi:iron complex transport system substrate-binding protein